MTIFRRNDPPAAQARERTVAARRLAESDARVIEIPRRLDALAAERDQLARTGGTKAIDRVAAIDAEATRLRSEASILDSSRGSLVQALHIEQRANDRIRTAARNVRRGELVERAEPLLRELVAVADQLAALRAEAGLEEAHTPRIFLDVAGWRAAIADRWLPDYFPQIKADASAGRALLDRSTPS